eukprot:scaffold11625_cov94-Skeletonema_dohrnii-CCMP3373.AAC.1
MTQPHTKVSGVCQYPERHYFSTHFSSALCCLRCNSKLKQASAHKHILIPTHVGWPSNAQRSFSAASFEMAISPAAKLFTLSAAYMAISNERALSVEGPSYMRRN